MKKEIDMIKIELYSEEDAKKDLEKGLPDFEIAMRKWDSILNALKAIESVTIQRVSFCFKHQQMGCYTCPLIKYESPCGHPYSFFTIFYQELKRLTAMAKRMHEIMKTASNDEREKQRIYG